MKKTTIKKAAKKEEGKIKVSLIQGDLVFKAEADTFSDAMKKLYTESFGKIKIWTTIKMQEGKKVSELKLRPIQIKKAFNMHIATQLLEDRLRLKLK